MPTTLESESRKVRSGGNGHGNGHSAQEKPIIAGQFEADETAQVLAEIMRLVDASKEGRLSERGKATLFNGLHREMIQGYQRNARRHSCADW